MIAKEFASSVSGELITSEIAGALWEWPPAVCGGHPDEESLDRAKVWCTDSYTKFVEMAMRPDETGVFVKQSVFYFKDNVEDAPDQLEKMKEVCYLPGFVHDQSLIEQTGELFKIMETMVFAVAVIGQGHSFPFLFLENKVADDLVDLVISLFFSFIHTFPLPNPPNSTTSTISLINDCCIFLEKMF